MKFKVDQAVKITKPTKVHELEGYKDRDGVVKGIFNDLIDVDIDGEEETFLAEELEPHETRAA